jgi:glutathione synthase/RimK-type ligase-like ATP-grasp enzyme
VGVSAKDRDNSRCGPTIESRELSKGYTVTSAYSNVAIATCAQFVGKEKEDLQVIHALGRHGIDCAHVAWDDTTIDWSPYDLVVIRSTWDYPSRREEFLAWATSLTRVLNPLPILKWNTDKRYLSELARAGLPVLPTTFLDPGRSFEVPSKAFVVKPAISCGAVDTARYQGHDTTEAHEHVRRLHASGRTVMIQPYLATIESQGETAVIYIGGHYSHSIRRDAVLQQTGLSPKAVVPLSNVRAHVPTLDERALADQVMAAVPGGSAQLLFARVDMIPGEDGKPLLLELELTEPSLFLEFCDGSAERLADCIASICQTPC